MEFTRDLLPANQIALRWLECAPAAELALDSCA
jgi:hypothetical protein